MFDLKIREQILRIVGGGFLVKVRLGIVYCTIGAIRSLIAYCTICTIGFLAAHLVEQQPIYQGR